MKYKSIKNFSVTIAIALMFLLIITNFSAEAAEYAITDLGVGISKDINNSGRVLGSFSSNGYAAFIWDKENGRQDIVLGIVFQSINELGQIVGTDYSGGPGWLYDINLGQLVEIPELNGSSVYPRSINNNGVVTGAAANYPCSFFWDSVNGTSGFNGDYCLDANDINDYGQVVGIAWDTGLFIWSEATGIEFLGNLSGSHNNSDDAYAMNNAGHVVGESRDPDGFPHAFLWDSSNGIVDLGTLYGRTSVAYDINNIGKVVGFSEIVNNVTTPFIWDNIHGMRDLSKLIPENSGWVLRLAFAINDSGQIVGDGSFNGESHAFLLTPISPKLVDIDIIPKTCPNECPIKGGGTVEVAILGAVDFDVNDIGIASVRLEGVASVRSSLKDKSSPVVVVDPQNECDCTTDGKDGFLDLCLKFNKKDIISALGEVTVDQEYVLTLSGVLNDGTPIEGKDCIVFVKKGKKH